MAIFLVVIDDDEKEEAIKNRLKEHYSDHYAYHANKNNFLVRSDDIADQIANNLGIKGDNIVSGVVLKINSSYSGFTSRGLWDWLGKDDG